MFKSYLLLVLLIWFGLDWLTIACAAKSKLLPRKGNKFK